VQLDAQYLIRNLLEIKGLHNYNYDDFKYALDFMSRCWRQFPFEKVVEKDFTLNEAQAAFEYAIENKPLRVGIKF
jgi:threonine dehydrogenase-like Zn-dependent dehydrogenase